MTDHRGPNVALTLAIPVYNPEPEHLRACLESVRSELRSGVEVLVSDDASSTPGTPELLMGLLPAAAARHRQPKNLGMSENWNWCVRASRGDWVGLFHQDDVLMKGCLEKIIETGRANPGVTFQFSEAQVIDSQGLADGNPWFSTGLPKDRSVPGSEVVRYMVERNENRICCPSVFVRREVYFKYLPFSARPKFTADLNMWLRMLAAPNSRVWIHGEPLIQYRLHPSQQTSLYSDLSWECVLIECSRILGLLDWRQRRLVVFRLLALVKQGKLARLMRAWNKC